jgi:hypothetical protein
MKDEKGMKGEGIKKKEEKKKKNKIKKMMEQNRDK